MTVAGSMIAAFTDGAARGFISPAALRVLAFQLCVASVIAAAWLARGGWSRLDAWASRQLKAKTCRTCERTGLFRFTDGGSCSSLRGCVRRAARRAGTVRACACGERLRVLGTDAAAFEAAAHFDDLHRGAAHGPLPPARSLAERLPSIPGRGRRAA
jgi:hypothetical protein